MFIYTNYVGVALYLEGSEPVQNNSIIRASITGRFSQLQCISGSTVGNVGHWKAPNGEDIDEESFIVSVGDTTDPGITSIELQTGVSLSTRDEGIYTCIIPDENGDVQYLYAGLYQRGFNGNGSTH